MVLVSVVRHWSCGMNTGCPCFFFPFLAFCFWFVSRNWCYIWSKFRWYLHLVREKSWSTLIESSDCQSRTQCWWLLPSLRADQNEDFISAPVKAPGCVRMCVSVLYRCSCLCTRVSICAACRAHATNRYVLGAGGAGHARIGCRSV